MEQLKEEMCLRGLSPKTVKAYCYHVSDFLAFCGTYKSQKKRDYILFLIHQKKSPETVRLAAAAIDFYIRAVRGEDPLQVPLPKRKQKLPIVLTKKQIIAMIETTRNVKHRLIIEILYSTGIRLSELIHLHVEDINPEIGTVRVRQGKGDKDRMTIISKRIAKKIYVLKSSGLVIEGRKGEYSQKSVQVAVKQAAKRAGISHRVTPHMIRHSFATHLLEAGVDIRYIQALLGHAHVRTTQIYTAVAEGKLAGIANPLE